MFLERVRTLLGRIFPGRTILPTYSRYERTNDPNHKKVGVYVEWIERTEEKSRFIISEGYLEFFWKTRPRGAIARRFNHDSRRIDDPSWVEDARIFSKMMRRGAVLYGMKVVYASCSERARQSGYNDRFTVSLTPEAIAEDIETTREFAARRLAIEEAWRQFNPQLLLTVDKLDLSYRARNCLRNLEILYVGDLAMKSKREILATPNLGRVTLAELEQALELLDCHFGMALPTA